MMKVRKTAPRTFITPTSKPSPQDMVIVSTGLVGAAQQNLLNPAAVIASLSCALALYSQNALESGFDPAVADQCRQLGLDLAEEIRKSGLVKKKSMVATTESSLVAPDGSPLMIETPVSEPAEQQVEEG